MIWIAYLYIVIGWGVMGATASGCPFKGMKRAGYHAFCFLFWPAAVKMAWDHAGGWSEFKKNLDKERGL